jgi:hypothetical protein
VPLLLQCSSSNTWPLLALNAVLHAKHPALPKTLGGNFSAVNLALAASLSSTSADGPLAALLQAAELISAPNNSSSGAAAADLDAALIAAEAVDPWAASMQLSQRVINSLWEALLAGRTVSTAAGSSSSSSSVGINTPEGAAAAWQAIVTDLLAGAKPDVALQLLTGFVNSPDGWEAGLRALAVAAALQRQSSSSSTALLQPLLARVCKRNRHPALAFLVLLLQQQQVQLAPGDTATVLDEALQQLLAYYGTLATDLPVAAGYSTAGAAADPNSSSEGSLAGWLGLQSAGAGGEIDAWGFDALFSDLDVFGDASAAAGPQYKSSSSLFAAGGKSEAAQQQQQQQVAMSQVALGHVESLVKAAVAWGHAVAAADFVMQMLALSVVADAAPAAAAGMAAGDDYAGSSAQLVFVVSQEQQDRLLALAADCCIAALADDSRFGTTTSNDEKAGAAAAAVAPAVLPSLLAALAAAGQVSSCIGVAVAVCRSYRRNYMANIVTGRHHASMSRGSIAANTTEAATDDHIVTARIVGEAITAAAAAVVAAEGSVSAVKPQGSALLAGVSGALFAADVPVEQCLVLLAAVAAWVGERLALQLVAASAAKLHSVMPQAVAVVRSSRRAA